MGFWMTTIVFFLFGVIASASVRLCCNRGPSTNLTNLVLQVSFNANHHCNNLLLDDVVMNIHQIGKVADLADLNKGDVAADVDVSGEVDGLVESDGHEKAAEEQGLMDKGCQTVLQVKKCHRKITLREEEFGYDDIETVEDSIGYCLVGCFMGRHSGRDGVEAVAHR
ncbi:hypothetical protein ZIOFF_019974 [Zingiber officinale]|uniref:Uncharacterized protein n=1 Tax=Zingiber officinale TaxID=94328 RepID=A0A8J5H844_ZINOF|nr:hypothetical protein ZIOFF_019974 [Zingiber officinale]